MNSRYTVTYVIGFAIFAILACGSKAEQQPFTPPSLDGNNGVLISINSNATQVDNYLPDELVETVHQFIECCVRTRPHAEKLCSFAPDVDTLYPFYRFKLFQTELFQSYCGKWIPDSLARNLRGWDRAFGLSRRDSARVFFDSTFVTNYASYLTCVDSLATPWKELMRMNSRANSVALLYRMQSPVLLVHNLENAHYSDLNQWEMFSDLFIKDYGWRTVPAYDGELATFSHAYIRYYDNTIHVVFIPPGDNDQSLYDISLVLDYPCNIKDH